MVSRALWVVWGLSGSPALGQDAGGWRCGCVQGAGGQSEDREPDVRSGGRSAGLCGANTVSENYP